MLGNIIIISIIFTIVAVALVKILSDRKKGIRCSGCPHSKVCAKTTRNKYW